MQLAVAALEFSLTFKIIMRRELIFRVKIPQGPALSLSNFLTKQWTSYSIMKQRNMYFAQNRGKIYKNFRSDSYLRSNKFTVTHRVIQV